MIYLDRMQLKPCMCSHVHLMFHFAQTFPLLNMHLPNTHVHIAADLFGKSLKRQTALVQLAKGARNVLRSSENVTLILNEWRCIDFEATAKHATYSQQISEGSAELIKECKRQYGIGGTFSLRYAFTSHKQLLGETAKYEPPT